MDEDDKWDRFLELLDRAPEILDLYLVLFIQQRNIRSGANTMDAQSGLTLIGMPGEGLLGLHPGGPQFTDKNGDFTTGVAGGGNPSVPPPGSGGSSSGSTGNSTQGNPPWLPPF
jgi:hypothetical protein